MAACTGWLAAMDELAKLPAARVVPGHGPPAVPLAAALADQRRYLELAGDLRAIIKRGGDLSRPRRPAGPSKAAGACLTSTMPNATAGFAELEWE